MNEAEAVETFNRKAFRNMTRDPGLEELVRDALAGIEGLSETTMFGGRAWMLHGNLLCCARHDGMLARLGKGREEWALALPDIAPMYSGSRRMHGWVRAGPDTYVDDTLRRRLIAAALDFVRELPVKR